MTAAAMAGRTIALLDNDTIALFVVTTNKQGEEL